MLKKSKAVSLVLALAVIVSAMLPLSASAAISFSDVPSDHTYYDAITNLAAEGIINGMGDGKYEPNQAVTRAQFTKIICYATYVGDVTYGEDARATFSDVAPDHWAINNIITAKRANIINGYDDGTFKPDQTVLYEQAVKMAACAIGYPENRAKNEGGYPDAYLKFALKQGLLEGVDGKIGEPLNRDKVAQLIDNMRDADRIDPLTGDIIESLREENATSSSVEGRIVAINTIALYHDEVDTTSCKNNQIEVELANGTREFYWVDNLTIENSYDYLGRSVTVYYDASASGDFGQATNIQFVNNSNQKFTVELEDVDGSSSSNFKLSYYDDDSNIQSIDIASDIAIIHNGQAVNKTFEEILTETSGKSGDIKLVCSGKNSSTADTALVTAYDIYYVSSVNRKTYTVTDSHSGTKTVTLEETGSHNITFTKNGSSSSFSGISSGNVVSVAKSQNGKIIDVLISDKTASGVVESIVNGKIKLKNSETLYEFAATTYDSSNVSVGNSVSLKLDAFGKIVASSVTSTTTYSYGYLAAFAGGSGGMSDEGLRAKIYKLSTSSSVQEGKVYTFADAVKIDGQNYKTAEDESLIENALRSSTAGMNVPIKDTAPTNIDFAQPIRFSLNSAGKINALITSNKTGENVTSTNVHSFTASGNSIECTTDGSMLTSVAGKTYSVKGAPVIIVPSDRTGGEYKTRNSGYFTSGTKYFVQLVNPTSTNAVSAVYVYGIDGDEDVDSTALTKDDVPMLVKESKEAFYNGITTWKLTLIKSDGTDLEVYQGDYAGTEAVKTTLAGDVVRVSVDEDSYVTTIKSVATKAYMDAENSTDGFSKNESGEDTVKMDEDYLVVAGIVKVKDGNSLLVAPSFDSASTSTMPINVGSAKKYYVSVVNDMVKIDDDVSADNIEVGSKLFIYSAKGSVKLVVIYE